MFSNLWTALNILNIHDTAVIPSDFFWPSVLWLSASAGHLGRLGHGQHLLDGPLADALVQLLHGPLDQAALLYQCGTTEGAQLHPPHHRHSGRTVRHRRQPGQRVSCTQLCGRSGSSMSLATATPTKYGSTAMKRSKQVFMCVFSNENGVCLRRRRSCFLCFSFKSCSEFNKIEIWTRGRNWLESYFYISTGLLCGTWFWE